MIHRDGFPRLSARSAWRGDAKASQALRPVQKHWAVRKPWETVVSVGRANRQRANRRRASPGLDDAPHRPRLPCYPPDGPTDRPPGLHGSLSTLLGISGQLPGGRRSQRGSWFFALMRAVRLSHPRCSCPNRDCLPGFDPNPRWHLEPVPPRRHLAVRDCRRAALPARKFRSHPYNATGHACDGGWCDGTALGDGGCRETSGLDFYF